MQIFQVFYSWNFSKKKIFRIPFNGVSEKSDKNFDTSDDQGTILYCIICIQNNLGPNYLFILFIQIKDYPAYNLRSGLQQSNTACLRTGRQTSHHMGAGRQSNLTINHEYHAFNQQTNNNIQKSECFLI